MKRNLFPLLALGLLCAGYLLFVAGSAPLLPERVAIHFGLNGNADNWTSRSAMTIFFGAFGVGWPLFFICLALLTAVIPARFVNLPHREFWLAPERRAETVAYISCQLIWMGCLMVLFQAGIYWLTIQANRATPARLPMNLFLELLAGFLAGVLIWSLVFIRHFMKVP